MRMHVLEYELFCGGARGCCELEGLSLHVSPPRDDGLWLWVETDM